MKPVDKGAAPRDAIGTEILYSGEDGHQAAKAELLNRLGHYCSYCERRGDLHVEHVIPKHKHPAVSALWVNYLLGCSNCNGIKKEKDPLTLEWDCLFPDEVNTGWAFVYGPEALVSVNPRLSPGDQVRAQRTLDMVGLTRNPASDPRRRDMRWMERHSAWEQAVDALQDLQDADTPQLRKSSLLHARATGFFSVWWTVFGNDTDAPRKAELCNEMIKMFKAKPDCYDSDGNIKPSL